MVGTMIIPTMQARTVGGTTVINSAICFRLPDEILAEWVEQEQLKGLAPEVLAPHFDEIEKILNISPESAEAMGRHNQLMKKGCEALGWQGAPISRNSKGCKGCGVCMSGCVEGAKLSMDRSYVPLFLELGGELYTDCRVEKILHAHGRAEGIVGTLLTRHPQAERRKLEVRAKAVVLACGTMGTPVVLQKNGLANSSGPGRQEPLQPHRHGHDRVLR